jgi:serine/threonine protein kinase
MAIEFENLGPYVVQGVLGRGGMGSVYKGAHIKSGQLVAIKVIASVLADQERFRRRFAAEIETLKRLEHPNIVELIGYGEERGHLFYSMEFVEGKSLQEIIRESGKLPWMQVIDICTEVCSALKQAHDQGIIHRDLKPANLMISTSGAAKLMDFGIAKLYWGTEVTAAGAIIGTADFMPPEQAEGKPVTTRSDIYAVGSLAYAALTGKAPFTGRSIPEVLYAVRYNPVTPIRDINRDVPPELAELVEEMLAKDPAERPPTALVVSNRLQALKAGLTRRINAKPDISKPDKPPTDKPISSKTNGTNKAEGRTAMNADKTNLAERAAQSNEMTSIDLAELGVGSLVDQGNPTANEGTFVLSEEERSALESRAIERRTRNPVSAGPNEQTVIATPSKINSEFDEGPIPTAPKGQTHFTVVDDNERRTINSIGGEPESTNPIAYWGSIGLLLTILIGIFISIYFYSRPETADQLFSRLDGMVEAGDLRSLIEAEPLLEEFRARFPNDSRLSQLEPYEKDLEYIRASRKITARARFEGGVNSLDPIEQAFLDCVQSRQENAKIALRKARAMVAVFGGDEMLSKYHQGLVDMARRMADELQDASTDTANPKLAALREQIRVAMTKFNAERKIQFLEGVIELFEEKVWASDAVSECREALKVLKSKQHGSDS